VLDSLVLTRARIGIAETPKAWAPPAGAYLSIYLSIYLCVCVYIYMYIYIRIYI
jgi:hypothetical protein